MTRRIYLALFVVLAVLALTACSSGPSPAVSKADTLVKAYITAYQAKDAKQTLSLFSEDAIYMDQGSPGFRSTGEMYARNFNTAWAQTFQDPLFQVKFETHFISSDGTSATLKTVYTNKGKNGNTASVPMIIMLGIKDGKIVREDDYYDFSPFK